MPPSINELDALVGVDGLKHHLFPRAWGQQHVMTAGPDDDRAPAVLLVHGWPQHWFAWRKVIAQLAREARVVAVDLRGFGWSTTTDARVDRTSITELAHDLPVVLDHLGIDRVTMAAHDWGGWIGFRAVLAHPDRFSAYCALAIMPPWLSARPMVRNFLGWGYVLPMAAWGDRAARSSRRVRWMVDRSTSEPIWNTPDGLQALATYVDRIGEPASPRMTRHLYRSFVGRELPAALGPRPRRLEMPTTVVLGEHERISLVDNWWRRAHPDEIRTVVVPEAGHWLPEEAPDAVVREIQALLPARSAAI